MDRSVYAFAWWPWRTLALLLALVLGLSGCGLFGSPPAPTAVPPTTGAAARTITVTAPSPNATVGSPILISGLVPLTPTTGTLTVRLFGPDGLLLAQGSIPVQGVAGGPGTFSVTLVYSLSEPGLGFIEILDLNPTDGSVLAFTRLPVNLSVAGDQAPPTEGLTPVPSEPSPTPFAPPPPAAQQAIFIDSPPPGTTIGSPVTITGRTGRVPAGNSLTFAMRDGAGSILGTGVFPVATTAENTGSFNASLTFNLPQGGGPILLEVFEPGAGGGPPVASAQLPMVIAPPQAIFIDSPPPGTIVGSPVTLTGRTARAPFQNNLGFRVLDANGRQLGIGVVPVNSSPNGPGSFNASINFSMPPAGGRITVELGDQNASNNQVVATGRIELNVAPQPQAIIIESPAANQQVGSPMTITGRTVRLPSGNQLSYRVRDRLGAQVGAGQFAVSGSSDGGSRFNAQIFFTPPVGGGPIAVEVIDIDLATNQVRGATVLNLTVAGPPPPPTATPAPVSQAITVDSPPSGTIVGSPVVVTGRAALSPQFRELYYVIRSLTRETLGQGSFPVAGQPGQRNVPFVASLTFAEPAQGGAIVVEIYDRDGAGQIIANTLVQLQINPRGGEAVPPLLVITPAPTVVP